jgi:hypothetical protein
MVALFGIAIIVTTIIIATLLLLLLPIIAIKLIRPRLETRIAENYAPQQILMTDFTANSFGQESKGVLQVRGNGVLVLTEEYLHFFRFVPGADLRVPITAITDLSFTKNHLGKATIYNLLKVRFSTNGETDSIAWYLKDPNTWKAKIEEIMRNRL